MTICTEPQFAVWTTAKAGGRRRRAASRSICTVLAVAGSALTLAMNAHASTPNTMTSFYNSAQNTEHVFFIPTFDSGMSVYSIPLVEFYYDGHWHANQNFGALDPTSPVRGTPLAGMFDGNVQHVFFPQTGVGFSGNNGDYLEPWELYYTGSWFTRDLTPGATPMNVTPATGCTGPGGPCVVANSGLSTLWDGQVEHVFYVDQTGSLIEAYNPGGNWFTSNLTAHSGDVTNQSWVPITSMWDGATEYVFYQHGGVVKMVSCGPAGCWNRVTNVTAPFNQSAFTCCTGFAVGSTLNVFFVSANDAHVHRLSRVSSGGGMPPAWSNEDVSVHSGDTADPATGLNAYDDGSTWHVFFADANGHIHELYHNGGSWAHRDVTISTGDIIVGSSDVKTPMTGFSDGSFNHLFYVGADGHIHEAYHTVTLTGGRWSPNDLNVQTGVGNAIIVSD